MNRFRNILAVYNDTVGSEAVLEQAVAVARAQGARLTLLKQVASTEAVEDARKRLRRIVPWVVQEGVTRVDTEVTVGTSHREIVCQVMRHAHDLVIASASSRRSLKGAVLGDTPTKLMRSCPCPVWLLKPEQAAPCARVLAAIGAGAGDPAAEAVNARIVELGTALAQSHEAEFHVMHAWSPKDADAALLTNEISDETREGILRRNEAEHRSAVNALLARCPVLGLDHEIHLPRGLPQQAIVSLADRIDADVVVMGSAWRAGMPRLLLGNPAETMFGVLGCGVLTVKPDGFEAPVVLQQDPGLPEPLVMAAGGR